MNKLINLLIPVERRREEKRKEEKRSEKRKEDICLLLFSCKHYVSN